MLEVGRPFSLEWERILYIWTNYNIEKVYDKLAYNGKFERIRKILDDAMNECLPDGKRTELQWWWSFDDNEVVSIIRPNPWIVPRADKPTQNVLTNMSSGAPHASERKIAHARVYVTSLP